MNASTPATREPSPAATFNRFLEKHKGQLALALPKHLNADRMARLALTAFNSNSALQKCDPTSVFAAVVLASQMGLEIGVAGQAYLVPYKGKATFVPGWMGIVDLVSRSGRATVWTGAVFAGDEFNYALGSRPFIEHKPCGEDDPAKITHVYACGAVKGMEHMPVIEVWPINRVRKHRDKNNKVGEKHYSYSNWEMYARKVPLLQVCKYMPKSIELNAALEAEYAAEAGKNIVIDGDFINVTPGDDETDREGGGDTGTDSRPAFGDAEFNEKLPGWMKLIETGKKKADDIITTVESISRMTDAQKQKLRAIATTQGVTV